MLELEAPSAELKENWRVAAAKFVEVATICKIAAKIMPAFEPHEIPFV